MRFLAQVQDRAYHTVQSLGKSQAMTKEGFLLCRDVPIARTGVLIYGEGETPLEVGPDGFVRVTRDPEEVFKLEAMASFEGKDIVNDHPPKEVDPETYQSVSCGVMMNIRRGAGIDDDLLIADWLIKDAGAIEDVLSGEKVEVSCGYDADYEQTGPGKGRQLNIVGNHGALVKSGRCGPRCAIQDEDRSEKMTAKKKRTVMDLLTAGFKAKTLDEVAALAKTLDADGEEAESGTTVHVHNYGADSKEDEEKKKAEDEAAEKDPGKKMQDTLDAILATLKARDAGAQEKVEEKTDDEEPDEKEAKKAAQDSAARLEVLVPGTKIPTRDAKAPAKFKDAMCACKRTALDNASKGEHAEVLKPLLAGHDFTKADAATVDALFIAASEIVKIKNNAAGSRGNVTDKKAVKPVNDAAAINARNREVWAAQGVKA